jgi:glycosyltransferase involved in cell wall biosynthesis
LSNKLAVLMTRKKNKIVPSKSNGHPLRICLLTYRGNPTCGGQGVYINYLSRALLELGHKVDVLSGPPYPELTDGIALHKLPSLDLYNVNHLFRVEKLSDLKTPVNQLEYLSMTFGGFPEPFTFGIRAYQFLRKNRSAYDIVHDNQCLSYGVLGIPKLLGIPAVATIHHPVAVDREMEIKAAKTLRRKIMIWRWYSFLGMQRRVSRRLRKIITVSECSKNDISEDFKIPKHKFSVVPNGINTDYFYPLPHVKRLPHQLLVTSSADTPLKGLKYLLEAVASIKEKRSINLTVIGKPKKGGTVEYLVKKLGLHDCVTFTGRIEYEDFARYYAEATMTVIPSLYEGFGMPAGEAMACGVPVISTTGGALPEVVGDAGILVPPADREALERAILSLLDAPDKCERLGRLGLERVKSSFTWKHAAQKTVDVYRETIDAYC